jgi:SAM-dependent methyltransferase
MDEFIEENRAHWEELAALHPDTDFYDVEAFLGGESTLDPVEPREVGDVEGASLLHLQCHFGLDTLSWARRGARVTGVDISETAVGTARELAAETGLADRARFVRSDVYESPDAPALADERFDVVYTSFGVLFWLSDLGEWADVVARFLRPGGTFYLAEHHPFATAFDAESAGGELRIGNPYFRERRSYDATETGSYAGVAPEELEHGPVHGWSHSLGEVVTAVSDAGLHIEFLHEYPWSTFEAVDAMERREHGRYVLPDAERDLPFVFTLRATRPDRDR